MKGVIPAWPSGEKEKEKEKTIVSSSKALTRFSSHMPLILNVEKWCVRLFMIPNK